MGRVQYWFNEMVGARNAGTIFVHEVVRKTPPDAEDGTAVSTVVTWLGGGCGGHRWSLDKPAAFVTQTDVQAMLERDAGGCRHG